MVQWYAIIARLLTFFLDPGCALLAGSLLLYPFLRLFRYGKSSTDQPSESARQNGGDAPNE